MAAGAHPKPLEVPGIRFDLRDVDGYSVAETEVVTWATVTGLNAGFTTTIQLTGADFITIAVEAPENDTLILKICVLP